MITPGALHTTRKTAGTVTRRCGADHVPAVRGNASETPGIPGAIDRERDAAGGLPEGLDRVHGRLERRSIRVLTPPKGLVSHPGVRRIARVTRYREPPGKAARDTGTGGRDHTGTAYPITSPGAGKASPEGPRALNRGHWAVENLNHRQRDCAFGGDACLTRTRNGPANRASLNSIAPAVILAGRRGAGSLAETRRRMRPGRARAIRALTRPRARRVPAPPESRRTSPQRITRRRKTAPASAHGRRTPPESARNTAFRPLPATGKGRKKERGKVLKTG